MKTHPATGQAQQGLGPNISAPGPRAPEACKALALGLSLAHTFLHSTFLTHTSLHIPNYLPLFVTVSVGTLYVFL